MTEIVTAALIAISVFSEPDISVESGWLSAYAPGMMDYQVDYRIGTGQAPADAFSRFDTFVAVADCSTIGDVIYLRPIDREVGRVGGWRSALVVDCAGNDGTPQWMEENRILAEVDWETWQDWQEYRTAAGLGVEVVIP